MTKNHTYNPEDLEYLLLHKSFDELLESEQEFVLQHIDSIKEYKELRNTLLSIKDYSKNNEQIIAEPRVKEELLELFEKEEKRAFWWLNLNTIGAFLFPQNTPVFRKPIFQMATFAVLAFFVLNIGFNLTENKSDNLALNKINSNSTNEFKKIEKPKKEPIQNTESIQKNEKPILKVENEITQPIVEDNLKTIQLEEEVMEELELTTNNGNSLASTYNFTPDNKGFIGKTLMDSTIIIVSKDRSATVTPSITSNKNMEGFYQKIPAADKGIIGNTRDEKVVTKLEYKNLDVDIQTLSKYDIQETTTNSVSTLNNIKLVTTEKESLQKKKKEDLNEKSLSRIVVNDNYNYQEINTNSQSLENNEDIIDLLHITM